MTEDAGEEAKEEGDEYGEYDPLTELAVRYCEGKISEEVIADAEILGKLSIEVMVADSRRGAEL